MTASHSMLTRVQSVAETISKTTHAGRSTYDMVRDELRSFLSAKHEFGSVFKHKEYEFHVGTTQGISQEVTPLEQVKDLALTSAPTIEAKFSAGNGVEILVLRYASCPDEDITPLGRGNCFLSEEARRALHDDIHRLAEQGLVHTYSRGTAHWFISSKTGKILLDSWHSLRQAEDEEIRYLVGRVELSLERLAAAASAPTASPDAPTQRTSAPVASSAPAMPAAPARLDADAAGDASARMRQVFGHSRVLLPVIHPIGWEPALDAVRVAVNAGVPGVFLINQGLAAEDVLRLVLEVRSLHPALWVGVNLLGYSPVQALEAALDACEGRIDGLWTDNAGIDERLPPDAQDAGRAFLAARQRLQWTGLYFGGVAFKYQRPVAKDALPAAAHAAAPYLDLLCTSGPGTGMEAERDKIATLHRAATPTLPLALASGVTPDNVASYLPFVHAFLVGTGLEHSLGILDPLKVAALQRTISGHSQDR